MDREYLATGFADVDRTQNKEDYFSCLALLDSLPYYRGYKTRSYDLLDLGPGMAVLDAGCGLGDDAVRMARRVSPGGRVIGLDASGAMIEKAKANPLCGALPVEFLKGDVKALPFADESFARCRIDRTLQHLSNPQKAIDELVRVLKPCGRLLAYDNDWDSFSITPGDPDVTATIIRLWRGSFPNAAAGRLLPEMFIAAGLKDVKTYSGMSVVTDFHKANQIYNLDETVDKAVAAGLITPSRGRAWLADLAAGAAQGFLIASLTASTVIGEKDKE